MKALTRVALVILFALLATAAAAAPTMNEASRLLQSGKATEAAAAYEAITAEDPENDMAWFQLAMAYHTAGQLEEAVRANTKAAAFPRVRSSALYNLACAQSLLGEKDEAAKSLQAALDAGFLDYDLIKTDSDLEGVREQLTVAMPPAREYTPFKGNNGVEFAYTVLLPEDYDPKQTYPALFAFAPAGGGPVTADWAIANLWGETNQQGWIVVVPVAPADGWISHPAHHALEDLLDEILETYKIENQQFHLAGFAEGARPACTYSGMSRKYFQSLSVASSYSWARWDDDEIARFTMPVHHWVGGDDEAAVTDAERGRSLMTDNTVTVTVLDGESHLLPGLHGGAWLVAIDETVR